MSKLAGDNVQVLVEGYDLTGDSNRVVINDKRDMYDVSSFASSVHKFIAGKRNVALEHSGYMNAANAQSHPVLKGMGVDGIVSAFLGQNADPDDGDPVYSFSVIQGRYGVNPAVGNFIPFSANFATKGAVGGWGVALAAPSSASSTFTNTSTGASQNNGSASSNGAAAYLHVLTAAASDTYSIALEGSTTGAFSGEETTLGTFIANASELVSERLAIAGTIPQYVRWKATRTGSAGDTVKIAVSLVRF